jgi:hypothetical protein
MTRDTGLLNNSELETVSGGVTSLIGKSTIVLPHIPRNQDLLTPEQIAKVVGFNPPIPRS